MNTIFLQLGSNLGDRLSFLNRSENLIEEFIGKLEKRSLVYESTPWGVKNQENFLNSVIIVKSNLSAEDILEKCQEIERKLEREKKEKWGERTIDIDILFYNKEVIEKENLKVPHPLISERRFVLIPLNEINSEFIHPQKKETISELLKKCNDTEVVKIYEV
jgi:2-amino-4-hydroxy-6-hydroxymethyldihydropteridine diphosphokinase